MNRNLDPALNLIRRSEGLRLMAYQDSGGIWTIGYGHTVGVRDGMTITEATAEKMLRDELLEFADEVEKLLRAPANDYQFSALLDFAYNLGLGALKGSTLLHLFNSYAPLEVVADQFLHWVYQGRTVLPGLVVRRKEERDLFLTNDTLAAA